MQKNEEVVLNIESLSGDGKTVARQEGMVFFVENAVPGDTVRARIWKLKKNYAEARAIEILSPSPLRVEPRCEHFGVCGGCTWQNLSYDAQLQFKHRRIIEVFKHVGGFQDLDIQPVIGCDPPFFYRNKMEFTFSNYRWLTDTEMLDGGERKIEVALGLHIPERFDKVLNIEECHLQSEISTEILKSVRGIFSVWNSSVYSTKTHEGYLRHLVIRDGKHTNELMVNLVTTHEWDEAMRNLTDLLIRQFPQITTVVNNITERKSMVAFGDREKIYHGPGFITERIGEYTFRISANSFFQTNTVQAEKLYNVAKQLADLKPTDIMYDLYCGTGTISIFLSSDVERVIGFEIVGAAIEDAERNAQLNSVSNCYFIQGDIKDLLGTPNEWAKEHPRPSVLVIDPPRSGMHPKVVERVIKLAPQRIVYVSCNPASQARDAKMLCEAGYSLKVIQPVDMFPHSDHIETVALFTQR